MNGTFNPTYSSNSIWRDEDDTRCLTLDIEDIESDITALETSKADTNHTHSGYAAADHTHTGYATVDHTHTGYASATDVTTLQNLVGDAAVSTQISTAVAGKVDVVEGKGLSSNDYTDAEKTKLADIETGANKTIIDSTFNVLSDNPVKNSIISTALAGKANLVHTHSDKADTDHTHDDRYYTESEIDTKLSSKVDQVDGKGLSTNDFTTAEKNKLAGIADVTPISKGGTGQTSRYINVSVTHQNAKTSSNTSCRYFPYLGMCWIRAYVVLNVALTAGTALTVIEVDGDYRPSSITALATHNNSANLSAYIRKNQTTETDPATIKIKSDTDLSAGAGIYISGWWTAV